MADILKIRRTNTTGNVPPSGSLSEGELASNIPDKKLWIGDTNGDPVELNAGISWVNINSDTDLVINTGYFVDSSSGEINLTLPLPPTSIGDIIKISDLSGNFSTNNVYLDSNENTVNDFYDGTLTLDIDNATLELVSCDNVDGWKSTDCCYKDYVPEEKLPGFITVWRTTTANESITLPADSPDNDFYVDWGDGTSVLAKEHITGTYPSHVYTSPGDYEIKISGICPKWYQNSTGDKNKIIEVKQLGDVGWLYFDRAFYGCTNMEKFNASPCNTSNVTKMIYMMSGWENMTITPDFTGLDTSKVTDMSYMMRNWLSITTPPDLTGFDTSKVSDMTGMMSGWESITTPPDLTGFDTSSVTLMPGMMSDWFSVTTPPDLTGFDTSNVTNMSNMMDNWRSITTTPDLSNFDTSNVTRWSYMFRDWLSITEIGDIGIQNFNISSLTYGVGFLSGSNLSIDAYDNILSNWSEQAVINPDVNIHFGTSKYIDKVSRDILTDSPNNWIITDGGQEFIPFISVWKTTSSNENVEIPASLTNNDFYINWGDGSTEEHVTNSYPNHTYASAGTYDVTITGHLPVLTFLPSTTDRDKIIEVKQLGSMNLQHINFYDCQNITSFKASPCYTRTITSISNMFGYWQTITTPPDLVGFDTSGVATMDRAFYNMNAITSPPDVSGFDTSNVTDMSYMFDQMKATTSPPDVSGFDTSNVTDMSYMFDQMYAATTPPDVSGFNMSNVNTVSKMFFGFKVITTPPDVSSWDTSNIVDMSYLFGYMLDLVTPPDVSGWDTSSTTDMHNMFYYLPSITTPPDVSSFDTSNVTNMDYMFYKWDSITEIDDIGIQDFDVSSLTTADDFLLNSVLSISAYDNILSNWGVQTVQPSVHINFNTTKYTEGGTAEAGRDALTNSPNNWVITDGGPDIVINYCESIWRTTTANETIALPIGASGYGTFYYDVDWGDGSTPQSYNNVQEPSHVYSTPGDYTVLISGKIYEFSFYNRAASYRNNIIKLLTFGDLNISVMYRPFYVCNELTHILGEFDSTNLTDTSDPFSKFVESCSKLIEIDASAWDVSGIRWMTSFAYKCNSLETINVSGWDLSGMQKITAGIANDCPVLTTLDVSGWNISGMYDLSSFVRQCDLLETIDISSWVLDTDCLFNYFMYASTLFDVDISILNGDHIKNAYNMCIASGFSNENYDKALIAWSAGTPLPNVNFHAGSAKYTTGGAAEAGRNTLTNSPNSWTITDGGPL